MKGDGRCASRGSPRSRSSRSWPSRSGGRPVAEVCRRHGVSDATLYKWKAKYGGMQVSDAKRLRSLDDENARLKRLLADQMLDNAVLKDLLGKS